MDHSLQAPLSTGFSRQEYQSGLPFPSSGDLPDPEIKPTSPALQVDSLLLSHQGNPGMQETQVQSLGWEDPLEKEMATHPSILAWKSPWTEEPGNLQSMGSQRVGHNRTTKHMLSSRTCEIR